MELHVQSVQRGSEADQYVVQNPTWSGVYMISNLSNIILQKVLTLLLLTATGPEVFVNIRDKYLKNEETTPSIRFHIYLIIGRCTSNGKIPLKYTNT